MSEANQTQSKGLEGIINKTDEGLRRVISQKILALKMIDRAHRRDASRYPLNKHRARYPIILTLPEVEVTQLPNIDKIGHFPVFGYNTTDGYTIIPSEGALRLLEYFSHIMNRSEEFRGGNYIAFAIREDKVQGIPPEQISPDSIWAAPLPLRGYRHSHLIEDPHPENNRNTNLQLHFRGEQGIRQAYIAAYVLKAHNNANK